MNIRTKLTLQFAGIVLVIGIIASAAIYFSSARYRYEDFYQRLHSKSLITTKLLIEVDEVDSALLAKIEKTNPVNLHYEKIRIFNQKNKLIYASDKENSLKVTNELLDKIRLNDEIRYKQGEAEVLGYMYKFKNGHFVVIISAVDINGLKRLNRLEIILIIVFSLSILISLLSGRAFAGMALRPIKKVIDQVNEISIKSLNLRVDEGMGRDEISKLAITFNDMLNRLEKSVCVMDNFIANASHELRTPLTAIAGQLEVVLFKDRDLENYKATVSSVLEEINNLIMISNRLLILAQVNSEKTIKDFKPLRIDELIWQSKAELQRRYPDYFIDLELMTDIDDESKLIASGNDQLLKIAIINLMGNACKFSQDHSVYVNLSYISNQIRVEFRDNGVGIPLEDQPYIFDPFHRGKNVLKIKGYGIGLSLADMIIKLHKGNLSFSSVINVGSTFLVTLPVKDQS